MTALRSVLASALLSIVVVGAGAAAPTKLGPSNSIVFPFSASTTERVSGTGCGETATVTRRLPARRDGIKVLKPRVGDRDRDTRGTRVTAVTVTGTAVRPRSSPTGPRSATPRRQASLPASPSRGRPSTTSEPSTSAVCRRRSASSTRATSLARAGSSARRPSVTVAAARDSASASPASAGRGSAAGRRSGTGTLRLDYCRPSDNCPTNGKRVKLVASKPDYCADSGKIEYLRLSVYLGKIEQSGLFITCT